MVVYALERVLMNETPLSDEEVSQMARAALDSGVTLRVEKLGMTLYPIEGAVLGMDRDVGEDIAKELLYSLLWKIKPYPDWIEELAKRIGRVHGTMILVSGEDRFTLRRTIGETARLVYNTGEEDIYISRVKIELNERGICIAPAPNTLEGLRRVYMLKKHARDDVKVYGRSPISCRCGLPDLTNLRGLLRALEIFQKELIDVRIPQEMCLLRRVRSA